MLAYEKYSNKIEAIFGPRNQPKCVATTSKARTFLRYFLLTKLDK